MTTAEIVALVLSSTVLLEIVKGAYTYVTGRSLTSQKQSVAQMDDDAKMRGELWAEIEHLRKRLDQVQERAEALLKENADQRGAVAALRSQVESLTQRLTAAQLERDIRAKENEKLSARVRELEQHVRDLTREIATLRGAA